MQFNGSKFEALPYYEAKLNDIETRYTVSGGFAILDIVLVCELDIDMSNDASFQVLITNLRIKNKELGGWILRIFKTIHKGGIQA